LGKMGEEEPLKESHGAGKNVVGKGGLLGGETTHTEGKTMTKKKGERCKKAGGRHS